MTINKKTVKAITKIANENNINQLAIQTWKPYWSNILIDAKNPISSTTLIKLLLKQLKSKQ